VTGALGRRPGTLAVAGPATWVFAWPYFSQSAEAKSDHHPWGQSKFSR
jgi:hypothetical protein